ncbi:MAG: RNA repair domain-containing protein [Candidatus Woesearchaeota archaeon]
MIQLTTENLRHYFWAMIGVIGIVLFWAGLWDGVGNLWFLQNPLVSLAAGVIILASSGLILKEFDPLKLEEQKTSAALHAIHKHPQKQEFHIKFHDRLQKKDLLYEVKHLKQIEKGFLIFVMKEGKEIFVPIHRVKEILRKGKSYWKHG